MNVLVLHDDTDIKGWLVDEALEQAEEFIRNGYTDLLEDWAAGTLKAVVIDVPENDGFARNLYEVVDGAVVRSPEE